MSAHTITHPHAVIVEEIILIFSWGGPSNKDWGCGPSVQNQSLILFIPLWNKGTRRKWIAKKETDQQNRFYFLGMSTG